MQTSDLDALGIDLTDVPVQAAPDHDRVVMVIVADRPDPTSTNGPDLLSPGNADLPVKLVQLLADHGFPAESIRIALAAEDSEAFPLVTGADVLGTPAPSDPGPAPTGDGSDSTSPAPEVTGTAPTGDPAPTDPDDPTPETPASGVGDPASAPDVPLVPADPEPGAPETAPDVAQPAAADDGSHVVTGMETPPTP